MTAAMVIIITAITPPGVVAPQEYYGDTDQRGVVLIDRGGWARCLLNDLGGLEQHVPGNGEPERLGGPKESRGGR